MQLSRHLHKQVGRVGQLIDSVCARWLLSATSLPNSATPQGEPPGESLEKIMAESASHDVTRLLNEWRNGNHQALEQLTPLVYGELRRLAARFLRREREGHTLNATALINEAYLQLVGQQHQLADWQNRAHFIGVAAHLMRNILVDHARAHTAAKRGGGNEALPLDEAQKVPGQTPPDVLALDEALKDLAKHDERKCRIVELRYFGGLSMDEISEVTGLSIATLRRDLRMAEAWLGRQIHKP